MIVDNIICAIHSMFTLTASCYPACVSQTSGRCPPSPRKQKCHAHPRRSWQEQKQRPLHHGSNSELLPVGRHEMYEMMTTNSQPKTKPYPKNVLLYHGKVRALVAPLSKHTSANYVFCGVWGLYKVANWGRKPRQ